jgi:hypothetical protein
VARDPKLPEPGDADAVPAIGADVESAPISSGRVTALNVAATGPAELHGSRGKRIADAGKDMLGKGVETLGSGLETIGDTVARIGEASKAVPIVGPGVAAIGEGITSVGESIGDLPRVARTRRGGLLVRSVVVSFALVFTWIATIAVLQAGRTDSPNFQPIVEHILGQLSAGRPAIEELYEKASPRFQEMVRRERFVDDMLDLGATAGPFVEVMSINEIFVTYGPTGRIGRMSVYVMFQKGKTWAAVTFHWDDDEWKLLGISVEVPPAVKATQSEREQRVAACADPMDPKRCDVHATADRILQQLRDGHAADVWDAASDLFQKQEVRDRFVKIQEENQAVLGKYRRIIAVTEAKVISGLRGYFDVLVEYSKTNVRASFGFLRNSKSEPWKLRNLKIALPMPRIDDLTRGKGLGAPPPSPTTSAPKSR